MIELLHWFQTNYPELKTALLNAHHNFDEHDTNPYHVEGDCWSHTMMVCKIAQLKGYDRVVQVAALLHDIGKPNARNVNPKNNHVNFRGHEALSATMAKPLVADLVKRTMITLEESEEILELIALHSYLYQHSEEESMETFKDNLTLFKHLIELGECDDLGRFSKTMGQSTMNLQALLKQIEKKCLKFA